MNDILEVKDDYIQAIRFLHQTKKYKNIEFHKLKMKEKGTWRTYWYLDTVDSHRLIYPSSLDRRLYNIEG